MESKMEAWKPLSIQQGIQQGRTGKSGGPVQKYELGPSAVAAAC